MILLKLTKKEMRILNRGDDRADALGKAWRKKAQAMANETGQTVEIYAPEGYVWDARMAVFQEEEE